MACAIGQTGEGAADTCLLEGKQQENRQSSLGLKSCFVVAPNDKRKHNALGGGGFASVFARPNERQQPRSSAKSLAPLLRSVHNTTLVRVAALALLNGR